jgi:hypothetical protein
MDPETYRQHYRIILDTWKANFPKFPLPDPSFAELWMRKYDLRSICDVICKVSDQKLKPKTAEEAGKYVSATLRDLITRRIIEEENAAAQERLYGKEDPTVRDQIKAALRPRSHQARKDGE